ncbi:MAG: mevalonate kinase [Oligoflexia bacterium]|nr:mevalonate kinase [Oligoflexia bacterium]
MKNENTLSKNQFPSKVLLFGEYSTLLDSWGLAIPYQSYSGELKFYDSKGSVKGSRDGSEQLEQLVVKSNHNLLLFKDYLGKNIKQLPLLFDLQSFERDLKNNIYFSSSIPQGYGIGSSGALVAAVFDRYGNGNENNLVELRNIFIQFENYFHGTSSGIDPLISFLKVPILIKSKDECGPVTLPEAALANKNGPVFFLINTNRAKKTGMYVSMFMDKCKGDKSFDRLMREDYIPWNNQAITTFLEEKWQNFYINFYNISKFQFENFSPMILPEYQQLWKSGLDSGEFNLKLCGSGGGGLILGTTKKLQMLERVRSCSEVILVWN